MTQNLKKKHVFVHTIDTTLHTIYNKGHPFHSKLHNMSENNLVSSCFRCTMWLIMLNFSNFSSSSNALAIISVWLMAWLVNRRSNHSKLLVILYYINIDVWGGACIWSTKIGLHLLTCSIVHTSDWTKLVQSVLSSNYNLFVCQSNAVL